jgi:hypothetical protein
MGDGGLVRQDGMLTESGKLIHYQLSNRLKVMPDPGDPRCRKVHQGIAKAVEVSFNLAVVAAQEIGCSFHPLTPNHDQHHLEPLLGAERVRLVGGHENHLSLRKLKGLAGDCHFHHSIEDRNERVERRGMFAQSLASVEGE